MTDKELLEAAAKAAGMDYSLPQVWLGWNPLADDGDALRLAVTLRMEVYQYSSSAGVLANGNEKETCEFYGNNPDPYAATRRAIVRAAAALVANARVNRLANGESSGTE